ncbi:MAG: 3-deoxy-D-manno-octulosonic acid transferase, partial [Planctomycetales bacterium]|nr:3-deoxy-D-manno-octulosonic acid transferase [Planctomycetales bacterium]
MSRLFSWLLNGCYAAVILLASPVVVWRAVRYGKYRDGWGAKLLGRVPARRGDAPCAWLHAVSVGEVNLLATTIAELHRQRPEWEIVISTTTNTGYELALKKYSDHQVFYCPLDFSWACAAAVNRLRPRLLVLAELELWPNLIAAAKRGGARVAIINGRLSDGSFRGYRRVRPLVAPVLRQLDLIAAQDEETAGRFQQLGADPAAVQTTGSLKFDGAETDRDNPRTTALKQLAGITRDDRIFVAGSTQAPEEQYAIDILRKLTAADADRNWEGEAPGEAHPQVRLIIVPRHAERFDEVARLIEASGIPWARRSQLVGAFAESDAQRVAGDVAQRSPQGVSNQTLPPGGSACGSVPSHPEAGAADSRTAVLPRWQILLVDVIGELGAWWGAADVGFVGGSFGSRGGQNMLEPAAYGVPTCFGPNTRNFRDIVRRLLAVEGAVVVNDAAELEQFVRGALDAPEQAAAAGGRARQLVLSQQGATRRTVELLAA